MWREYGLKNQKCHDPNVFKIVTKVTSYCAEVPGTTNHTEGWSNQMSVQEGHGQTKIGLVEINDMGRGIKANAEALDFKLQDYTRWLESVSGLDDSFKYNILVLICYY